jgi:hypothetical protein
MPIKFYGLDLDFLKSLDSPKNIDIYIDTQEYHHNNHIKIYIQCEPSSIYPCHEYLENKHERFNYILCYDTDKIKLSNCIKKIDAGTWIPKEIYSSIDTSKKEYKISNLTGFKTMTPAHTLRHILYINQEHFVNKFPITFFRSSAGHIIPEITNNPLLPKTLSAKTLLFETFQYSIVIENTREKNYFSEKLMDCLVTKTIPIYYGCENISDYFNTEGWILLNDEHFLEDLFKGLSQLDSTYYSRYFHIVNKNYEKALNIADRGKVYCRMLEPYL